MRLDTSESRKRSSLPAAPTADISIVVTTYNRADLLAEALESLARQQTLGRFSFEIVVVDNGSTDNTRTVVEKFRTSSPVPLRYVREREQGVAFARNRGLRVANSPWLAFFDDDQLADEGWLLGLFTVAAEREALCVGGQVLLDLPGEAPPRLSAVCREILGESVFGEEPHLYRNKSLPGTGNVLISRRVFEAVGSFDGSFSKGCEDTDFFRRVRRKGIAMWHAPQARVLHRIPPHRLKDDYFIWTSMRQGVNYAALDFREKGMPLVLGACLARLGQGALFHLPRLIQGAVRRDRAEQLGAACRLWRGWGYFRRTLFLLSPRFLPQERFFARLEFREEKKLLNRGPLH